MSLNTPQHCCNFCGKTYTRKNELKKHLYICEITSRTQREINCDEEENTNIPNISQLYKIILEMGKKIERLEKQAQENEVLIQYNKKKLNITNHLNNQQNLKPQPFFTWIKNIIITQNYTTMFFENDFIFLCSQLFTTFTNSPDIPIKSFTEKKNIIYIYDDDAWRKLTNDDFIILLKTIYKKIFTLACEWKKINHEEFKNNKTEEIYNKNMIRLLDIIEFNNDTFNSKIRTKLYQYTHTLLEKV